MRGSLTPRLGAGCASMAAVCLALAAPASAAVAPRALYVADGTADGPGSVAQFSVSLPGGMPSPLGPPEVATGADPQHLAMTSDGHYAYASAAQAGLVYAYRARSSDGSLRALSGDAATAGAGTHGVAVSPDDGSFYAANQGPGTVSQYDLGRGGALAPKDPAAVASGAGASGVAVAPDGRSVYVTNLDEATVSQYDVDRKTGGLTPMEPATVTAPRLPGGIGVSPDGRSLYVATLSGRLAQYRIDRASRGLRPMSPATVPVGIGAAGIAITPDGRFVYTPDGGTDSASQFAVDRRGRLVPLDPAAVPAGDRPEGAGVTPDGRSLYVANAGANALSWFSIDPRTGRLNADPTAIATGPEPHGLVVGPNQGPRARFRIAARDRVVRVGERVGFDATASRDPDGEIVRHDWRFGDGTVRRDGPVSPAHRYREPGRYAVRLRVIDDERCSTHRIYIGATTSCNGGRGALARREVRVRRR